LDAIHGAMPPLPAPSRVLAPIQQGLADDNPDVDAIYRLTLTLPFTFERQLRLAIGDRAWCPFNSQNTVYYREAFPLLYLPAHCSFRMTDIWRSFVAQRICWANGWTVLFREATVAQYRNDHDLMRDFADEVSGYLGNRKIARLLEELPLQGGISNIGADMRSCYGVLVENGFIGPDEMPLLDAFLRDVHSTGE
ncbi:MAG TPA: STELLO glycosyltransferase family protein, partial [Rubrivivax sp.]|nr:STELLO glycosyltransferase family protein [Rubrivivax sp.]